MVYVDISDLGWQPFVDSWLQRIADETARSQLRSLVERAVPRLLEVKKARCKEPVPSGDLGLVRSLTHMYDAMATPENGVKPEDGAEAYARMVRVRARVRVRVRVRIRVSVGAGVRVGLRVRVGVRVRVKVRVKG